MPALSATFAPGSGPDDVSCDGLGSELAPDADRSGRASHTITVLFESGDPGAGHVEAEKHAGRRPEGSPTSAAFARPGALEA